MKRAAFKKYLIVMMCVILCSGYAIASGKESVHAEKYIYEAVPTTGDGDKRETVEMEVLSGGENIHYSAKISSLISREEIKIETDKKGQFISGTRSVLFYDKGVPEKEKILREKDEVLIRRKGEKLKSFDLPEDKRFAVDGSLLLLLRFFPFDSGATWKIFMVDFTGYAITVEAQIAGTEMITVPAGTFECYRVEVIVGIPVLRPRIVYWLAKDAPHFLLKSVGKRGPFTDTYITTLISRE